MFVSGKRDKHQTVSDAVKTKCCDHCNSAGLSVEATIFCENCEEFLCVLCGKRHAGAKCTKSHKLRDIQNIDDSSSSEASVSSVLPWQECPTHAGEAIWLFCQSHNALCCLICFAKHHKTCQDTTLISDIAKNIENNEEFKSFKADLKKVEGGKSAQHYMVMLNERKCESEHNTALRSVERIAEKAHLCIDKMKDNTIKVIDQRKQNYQQKIKQISDTLRGLDADLQGVYDTIEREEKSQPERVFIAWKNSQSKIEGIESVICQLRKDSSVKTLRLGPTKGIVTLLNTKNVLGYLSETQVTLKYIDEINVKSTSDKKDSLIDGIALLCPNKMIVSDFDNKTLKAIEIKDNKIVQTRLCIVEPNDVTLLGTSKIGVTLCKEKTIRVLSADDKLDHDRDIKVDTKCLSVIQEQHGQLIVSYHKKVQVLDMTGTVIREFSTDTSGYPLFKCARHLALSPDQCTLYVSDMENHAVTCLTLEGEVKSVYRDAELKTPLGIAVDDDGHVLVCSQDTHSIHVLTPDCVKLKVIPVGRHRLKYPAATAFCPNSGRLYISSANTSPSHCNSIKMFELE